MLLKSRETEHCVLTFEGTDTAFDLLQDLKFWPVDFCGYVDEGDEKALQWGHTFTHWGFKYHLLRMVAAKEFQDDIRQKLPQCESVSSVGHSLGGAMATLFGMCVTRAPMKGEAGYRDYSLMGWSTTTTTPSR